MAENKILDMVIRKVEGVASACCGAFLLLILLSWIFPLARQKIDNTSGEAMILYFAASCALGFIFSDRINRLAH